MMAMYKKRSYGLAGLGRQIPRLFNRRWPLVWLLALTLTAVVLVQIWIMPRVFTDDEVRA